MSAPPRAAIWRRAPRLSLACITVAAFANAVPNGFVWLDHWQVESGGIIARSWPELWTAWREPLGAMPGWEGSAPYARPLVILVLSVVHALAGLHPPAYHLMLGMLHLTNVLLVYGLLGDLGVGPAVAFVAATLFAVHPLQTAAVSWISGIADPLFTLFALLACRCQLAPSAHRTLLRLCAVLCFLLALGAKETAAMLPLILLAVYRLAPQTLTVAAAAGSRTRTMAAALAPFCAALAGLAFYRATVLRSAALGVSAASIPVGVRLLTLPRLLLSYVVLPFRLDSLTICDDYALSAGWDTGTMLALVALAFLLLGVIRARRQAPYVALGVIWMLLGLVPVLNIVPILHYRADRFFYFPFIGWSLALVASLDLAGAAVQRIGWSTARMCRLGAGLALLSLIGLVVLTVRRNRLFADDVSLFEATVQASPHCREAHTALGDAYLRKNRESDAATQYELAWRALPGHASYAVVPKILINLGMARMQLAQYAAAATAFTEAHRLQPELLHPLFGLGVANLGLGRVPDAAAWLEQAYGRDPRDPDVVFNLALADDRLGRTSAALELYQRYLEIAPRGRARPLAEARYRALQPAAQ